VRVCIVYDCLFPYTVGGAQRWYRNLAEQLAERGHEVTYLTLRQWPRGEAASVPGVEVVAVGPQLDLYVEGRRRTLPPVIFGLGVFWHLLRHGRTYDAVHTGSMPYFSLLAAAALRRRSGYKLFVDWIEVWTRRYWREYVGRVTGEIGWRIQRRCARTRHTAFAFARLHAERLKELGYRGRVVILDGLYAGGTPAQAEAREPVVVYAGRHIPEKGVPAVVTAFALARREVPELRAEIYGDGPDRDEVLSLIERHELDGSVSAPGFVEAAVVRKAIGRALCFVLPSRREGYGLVVVEASAAGTPTVVVSHPDNAAAELVEDGRNGIVVKSTAPEALAEAIVRVHEAGERLRESTRAWYRENESRLSIEASVAKVIDAYEDS
jgi:glycosyltransferase involved in cell wall biosynthesis